MYTSVYMERQTYSTPKTEILPYTTKLWRHSIKLDTGHLFDIYRVTDMDMHVVTAKLGLGLVVGRVVSGRPTVVHPINYTHESRNRIAQIKCLFLSDFRQP